jgi:hypothetical protein
MKSLTEILGEARFVASADYVISKSGRKMHKQKKIADTSYADPKDEEEIAAEKEEAEKEAQAKRKVKESLDEAVTVKKDKYSWGKMVTVHHGSDTSYPLHPEHQEAIKKLKDGEHTSFTDETNRKVSAHREGDNVHLSAKGTSRKTTVAHSHFNESVEQIDELKKSTLSSYVKKASDDRADTGYHSGYWDRANDGAKPEYKSQAEKEAGQEKRKVGINRALKRLTKEETEQIQEAIDKQDTRLMQLARLGLVDKDSVSQLRIAMSSLKAEKTLTVAQRTLLLNVTEELISLVTGDDMVFNRVKMDVQKESKQDDVPFDGPYTKTPTDVKDKSGAVHTPQSRARHLARIALQAQKKKSK